MKIVKEILLVFILFIFNFYSSCVETETNSFSFQGTTIWKNSKTNQIEETLFQVDAWGNSSLRVRIGPKIYDTPGALVVPNERGILIQTSEASWRNGNLEITQDKQGYLTFQRVSDQSVLFKEMNLQITPLSKNNLIQAVMTFSSSADERIYGLGEKQTGKLNNKGLKFSFYDMINYDVSHGGQNGIPFYFSSKEYGFLWNLPSFGYFNSTNTVTEWKSEAAEQVDFWVTTSDHHADHAPSRILHHYVDATGHAPLLPYFASGFWQSKNRYRNQTEVLDVAQGYLSRGLPLSVVVIDYFHWVNFGDWSFDPKCWPNPLEMTRKLKEMGIEVMVSVWPDIDKSSKNFAPMAQNNYFVGCPSQSVPCHNPQFTYDPTISDARKFVWQQVKKGYYDNGIKTYWLDADEPEEFSGSPHPYNYSIGLESQVGMMFPFWHAQTFYEGLTSLGETEFLFLSRCAWAGNQRFHTAVWSGDIQSNFATLTQQIRLAMNIQMSGIAWFTTDIGGYQGGNINDPVFRELIVRWFQFGAFCPLFRVHGYRTPAEPSNSCGDSGGSNEIWNFGDPAFQAISIVMHIREQLRPYVMQQMELVSRTGTPVMRPLWWNYPNDTNCIPIEDEFMFGPDYLVVPVTEYQLQSRKVYLPLDSQYNWVHWFDTNKVYTGGQWIDISVLPLQTFPLFYRQAK